MGGISNTGAVRASFLPNFFGSVCDSANTQVYFCGYPVGQRSCASIERRRENQDPRHVPPLITLATKPTMTTLVGSTSYVL